MRMQCYLAKSMQCYLAMRMHCYLAVRIQCYLAMRMCVVLSYFFLHIVILPNVDILPITY